MDKIGVKYEHRIGRCLLYRLLETIPAKGWMKYWEEKYKPKYRYKHGVYYQYQVWSNAVWNLINRDNKDDQRISDEVYSEIQLEIFRDYGEVKYSSEKEAEFEKQVLDRNFK